MAAVPADNKVRPPAGPGALANRQDLTGNQPMRIPTGLPYGQAGALQQQEQAVPMPQGQGTPGALGPGQGPPVGQPGAPEDPRAILAAVAGHATDFPQQPLSTQPAPDYQSLAFKVDALRFLSALPFSSPAVQTLLKQANFELAQATTNKYLGAPVGDQPVGP